MNGTLLVPNDRGTAELHNYNRLSTAYPPVNRNSAFPDVPPPAYSDVADSSVSLAMQFL